MESDESNNTPPPPAPPADGGAPSSYKWNPTKEQLSMLENMYNEGIRTPTREQIEEMTNRVKEYGPVEGKNVFFWFHNRRAKEKRKHQEDHMAASFNRLMQRTPPPSLPPAPAPSPSNVVCNPCNLPPSDLGFYPRCRRPLLPALVEERRELPKKIQKTSHSFAGELSGLDECRLQIGSTTPNQETLTLFPMHPTGILQEKANSFSNSSQNSVATATTPSSSSDTTTCVNVQEAAAAEHHFFDFFKGH